MKPTSLIFLALAAVLLFSGWFTCYIADTMADAQGISIYEQKRNKKGDMVYVYNLSDQTLSKLSLNFSDVDVTIIGSAKSSYVELKNFDSYDYSTKLSGGSVSIDGTISGLSSFVDMSGGGLRFKGLRYFFADKPMKGHKRSVTIYLSDSSSLKTLNLTLNNGNVSLQKIWNDTVDYNVTVSEGSATFDQVVTTSVININVSAGDINVANSKAATLNANIVGGNLNIDVSNYAAEFVSYNVKTSNSTLAINDAPIENGQHRVVTPSDIQQCLVKVDGTDAVVKIKDNTAVVTP